jgi:alpha-mannosidase
MPLVAADVSLLALAPRELELTTVKPAKDDDGVVGRVLNPTDAPLEAYLRVAWEPQSVIAVRLDETKTDDDVRVSAGTVAFDVPAHALRSVLVR